ncbi:MAG TPA: 50S ribosomal protein L25 [Vampirovibrionales bacterium]
MNASLELQERDTNLNPRQTRQKGFIPVTIYGKSLNQSLSLQVDKQEFVKKNLSKHVQTIEGKTSKGKHLILVKSVERNPVTEEILNIQFHAVDDTDIVKSTVPISYVGTSPLVRAGGVLFINNKTVNISCKASQVPASIEFDLANIADDKSSIAYFNDLNLEEGITLRSEPTQIIAKVSAPKVVQEDDASTPEVKAEEKSAEEKSA